MSAVKVEVSEDFIADAYQIYVDGKRVATITFQPFLNNITEALKKIFEAMDIENVEVNYRN